MEEPKAHIVANNSKAEPQTTENTFFFKFSVLYSYVLFYVPLVDSVNDSKFLLNKSHIKRIWNTLFRVKVMAVDNSNRVAKLY